MSRRLGYGSLLVAVFLALAASALQRSATGWVSVEGVPLDDALVVALSAGAVAAAMSGLYRVVLRLVVDRARPSGENTTCGTRSGSPSPRRPPVPVLAVLTRQ